MPLKVTDVVLARAKVGIRGWARNRRTCRSRPLEMRIKVVHVDTESLRGGPEPLRTCHAIVRSHGPKHYDVRAEPQLRMSDDLPRLRNREYFDEAEGRAEPSNGAASALYRRMGTIVCMV